MTETLLSAPAAIPGAASGAGECASVGPRVPPVPRLLAWFRGWSARDWALLDVAVAVVAFVGLTLPVLLGVPSDDINPLATVALGAASTLPIAVRRRWPLGALVVITAAITASLALGVRTTPFDSNAGPGVVLAIYTAVILSRSMAERWWIVGGTCGTIAAGYGLALWLQPEYQHNSVQTLAASGAWWVAENVRIQRCYRADLDQRRRQEADERTRLAAAEERLRLSREVHDVVSHSLSVIAVRSGVGRMVGADRPEEAVAALGAIETASRGALDELRRVLTTARAPAGPPPPARAPDALDAPAAGPGAEAGPDGPGVEPGAGPAARAGAGTSAEALVEGEVPSLRPAPVLADVPALVEGMAADGLDVTLRYEAPTRPSGLPPALERSAYRIVQEGLTNVVRHAAGSPVEVTIVHVPGGLTIEVLDRGPVTAPTRGDGGFGLVGVGERVALFGGTMEAGPRPGGGFRLAAHLPSGTPAGPSEEPAHGGEEGP